MDGTDKLCDEMSFEKFKMWSVKSLKVYLRVRGKSNDGGLDDLAAKAYSAWFENVPVIDEIEASEIIKQREYKNKLQIDSHVVPDPLLLKVGWQKEKDPKGDGILKWPSTDFLDIANFVGLTQPDFVKRMQSDYKQGKCYRYFSDDFVREILYHPISLVSDLCIIKCKVVPSHRVNSKPYDVWAVLKKDKEEPGGEVKATYCSCTAGLEGTCNHVVAMLFRIEHAVRFGLTKPTSTSKLCPWNVPSGSKVNMKARKIKEIAFEKSHFMKNQNNKAKVIATRKTFQKFSPTGAHNSCKTSSEIRNELYNIVKDDISGSVLWEVMEAKSVSRDMANLEDSINCPTLLEMAESFKDKGGINSPENFSEFIELNDQQLNKIVRITIDQSQSDQWFNHRAGRITASKFRRVYTRSITLQKLNCTEKIAIESKALVSDIMGYKKPFTTYATKHGISLEPHAKVEYERIGKKKHSNLKTNESGLVVMKTMQYIAASPDLEVECKCCGKGLVEIKCPFSIKGEIPSAQNLKYLEGSGEKNSLKKNTDYFFQIQGQLGVTGNKYCDFFVYTTAGNHLERVTFDPDLWADMLKQFEWFWMNAVLPELLGQKLKNSLRETNIEKTQTKEIVAPTAKKPKIVENNNFFCQKCNKIILEDPQKFEDFSIGCDKCLLWFHFNCVGISDAGSIDTWYCDICK